MRKKECIMCGRVALCIDRRTDESLCESCSAVNERIYRSRGEAGEYKR